MRFLGFLCILFTIPLLAVIGHDIYYAYNHQGLSFGHGARPVQFSDAGWLWLHYAGDSFHAARTQIRPSLWKKFVGPVLEHKSVIVAAVPAFVCYILYTLLRLLKTARRPRGTGRNFDYDGPKARKIKYGRK